MGQEAGLGFYDFKALGIRVLGFRAEGLGFVRFRA